jgi:putative ubiquitin-RnfH superfamily antitoxin RatB of RatAB toxin-antitoxin module
MAETQNFTYEVAYATKDRQLILTVNSDAEMTAAEAIQKSGILESFPEIDAEHARIGIFGKVAKMDAKLEPGDRVEIYRPLIADPKEARKKRAAEGKVMRKGAREANQASEAAED